MMTSCSRSTSISVLRTQHGDYHITVFMLGLCCNYFPTALCRT